MENIKLETKKNKKTFKLKSRIYKRNKARYIKISKNQLRILDALLKDGGNDEKYYDSKKKLRYYEHSGLLDFGKSTLQRIVVSTKPNLTDKDDPSILLPENIIDAFDYEYIFHTHPSTPTPISRIKDNILYDFPSVSDIFHFIEHHNEGITQGSMVLASEGLYIIKCIDNSKKIIIKREEKIYNYLIKKFFNIQMMAIEKYSNKINLDYYYKKIIHDKKFIKLFNNSLKKLNIIIKYYPRKKVNNMWILKDIYIKVNPIE